MPGRMTRSQQPVLLAGVGLLFSATAAWSARIVFPYLIVWLLLTVPALRARVRRLGR
jgi:uncharacterized membrane protein YtjA (UPF0391 family)